MKSTNNLSSLEAGVIIKLVYLYVDHDIRYYEMAISINEGKEEQH